jgi:NAD(P)-dependent dehydrogenase (short-subunit alcohol dehydrogenase family)
MAPEPVERKVALITGANRGIGLEIARHLGRQGMTVLVRARDAGRGREAAEQLRSEGINAYLIPLDVTSQAPIDQAARRIEEDFGRLDILCPALSMCSSSICAMVRRTVPLVWKPNMGRSAHFTTG